MNGCEANGCESAAIARAHCQKHYRRLMKYGDANYIRRRGRPAEDRFWEKVDKSGECWNWTAHKKDSGYGIFQLDKRRSVRAHRFAYELTAGQIPSGMDLDHTCHNRGCVNPAHLRPVTHKQNLENLSGPQSRNISGARGVFRHGDTGRWRVQVKHNRKAYYAGIFTSIPEAAEAARQLRLSLFTHNDVDRKAS